MDSQGMVYALLGCLQVIGIGLGAWVLATMVKVLERLAQLEAKFDEFPIKQISNNRHRIEQLERAVDRVQLKCQTVHPEASHT